VIDAFDADVVIYSAGKDPIGLTARRVLATSDMRIGSVVLLPEVLSKPIRQGSGAEREYLTRLLSNFELKDVDLDVAEAATTLGAKYGLRAADAIHLATAVVWGAERFYTNNSKDFGPHITEIDAIHLSSLIH
jgi:predicted nucleic acid-binding protein